MKHYILLYILGSIFFITSCSDGLDIYPPDKVTVENYWKTADDALRAVNATYQFTFPELDTYGCDLFFLETASDNAYPQFTNQFGNFQQIALNAFESNHPALQELWSRRYNCIRRCADFLVNIDKVDMDSTLKRRYTGEVLFQRAYAYYYLIAQWGDVPWISHPLTIQEASKIKCTNKYAIAKQIIKDLDYAAASLPSSYTGADDGRATKWAAFALKSRICLFMAGDYRKPFDDQQWYWEQARDATDSIILKSGKVLYTPNNQLSGESYRKLFYDNNASTGNGEVIYDSQFTNAERALYGFTVKIACISDGGWNSWVPTQSMIDAYEVKVSSTEAYPISDPLSGYDPNNPYKNRDPRLAASVYYTGPGGTTLAGLAFDSQPGSTSGDKMDQHNGTPTGYGWKKYVDPSAMGTWDTGRDFPLIRLAEVYLNAAEVRNELASSPATDPKIRNYSGMSRWRVGMPDIPNGLSKDEMRQRIRNERRVELAFEGARFFDIRRWGIAEEVLNMNDGWIIGMKLTNNPSGYQVVTGGDWDGHIMVRQRSKFTAQQYVWPIPSREIELNPNLAAAPLTDIE